MLTAAAMRYSIAMELYRSGFYPTYTPLRWDAAAIKEAVARVYQLVKGKFDGVIGYSFDSQDGKGLLDFLATSATKRTALEYLAEVFGAAKQDVVFCGDSGNDTFPLTAEFYGVLVRNADDQLAENVKIAMDDYPNLKVYFAKGHFKGLKGYYTSGVIEAAYHFGVFN